MTMSSESNDLSPYELARLERIKRNQDRLRSLGLVSTCNALKSTAEAKGSKMTPNRKRRNLAPAVGTRSSMRLKESKEGGQKNKETLSRHELREREQTNPIPDVKNPEEKTPEENLSYSVLPVEPDHLDDHEFQVYATLRAWRLRRSNELEIEPYKVCQNRTLCFIIRRKRNEAVFASRDDTKHGNVEATVERDLLSVWGIGPSKAAADGFGWEMLDILDSDENVHLLELSRKNTTLKIDSCDE